MNKKRKTIFVISLFIILLAGIFLAFSWTKNTNPEVEESDFHTTSSQQSVDVMVSYLDEQGKIIEQTAFYTKNIQDYIYAKEINGYELIGNPQIQIDFNQKNSIIFTYRKVDKISNENHSNLEKEEITSANAESNSVNLETNKEVENKPNTSPISKESFFTIRYVDCSGALISKELKQKALVGIPQTFYAQNITGYQLLSPNQQTTIMTKQGENKIIVFVYEKIQKGTFVIRYIDENGKAIKENHIRQTIIGQENIFEAPLIDGYTLLSSQLQKGILTTPGEEKVITFSYNKIKKGTFVIRYLDKNQNNLLTIEKREAIIGIETAFYAKEILGYDLISPKQQNAILTQEGEQLMITFFYQNNKKGTFLIHYLDTYGNKIVDTEIVESYTEIKNIFHAKDIPNYDLISSNQQSGILHQNGEQKEIIFRYQAIQKGTFTIQYLDEKGISIIPPETKECRINQEETFTFKEFEDYQLTSDETQKGILTINGENKIITFTYQKLHYGKITVRYVDENFKDITSPVIDSKAIIGKTYTYHPKEFKGYLTTDHASKCVMLSKIDEQEEVIFHLQEDIPKGDILIKYQDDNGNRIQPDKSLTDLNTKQKHQITTDRLDGYTLQGNYVQEVIFSEGVTHKDVTFVYTKDSIKKDVYVIELDRFHIRNDGSNAKESTQGINDAIRYALKEGYHKIKLPKGTYTIDQSLSTPYTITDSENKKWTHNRRGIALESNMQFDIQDCVLKQLPCEEPYTSIITISGCENTKVIGGTIIGDKYEHYYGSRINENGRELESGDLDPTTGEMIEDSSRVRTKNFITAFTKEDGTTKEIPSQFFVMPLWKTSKNTVDGGCRFIYCYDEDGNYLGMSTGGAGFIKYATLQPGTKKIKISFKDETRLDATYFMTERTIYSTYEYGAGITVGNSNHIELVGCTIKSTTGDCIFTYPIPLKVTVDNFHIIDCQLSDSRRQGISYVATGENNLVKNTTIKNIAGVDPQCGIDFEHYDYCKNTIIDGCTFYNNKKLDIVNYNGTDIEIKNSRFAGMIGTTYGYGMRVHDNYFEYDAKQDSIFKTSGINLQTKDNIAWNNQLFNADLNVTGENSEAYGNHIEGGKVTIRNSYRNTYKNIENVLIDRREGFASFEGSEFINCNINLGSSFENAFPMDIKHCKFINSKLNARGVTHIKWCDFENTTKSIQDGWGTQTAEANYYKCNINTPSIRFIADGTSRTNRFEECKIITKRETIKLYGSTHFKNTSIEFITGDSDPSAVIKANVGIYGKDRSPWYFENCEFKASDPVSIHSDNGHETNSIIGPITLEK